MPRTIEQGFQDFHNTIKASAAETEATVSHRASIKACLEKNFGLKRFTRIGSFGNGAPRSLPAAWHLKGHDEGARPGR